MPVTTRAPLPNLWWMTLGQEFKVKRSRHSGYFVRDKTKNKTCC